MHMIKIGVLLPGSTMYPSIGVDFLAGVKSCFLYYGLTDTKFILHPVSFGLNEQDIYNASERMLVSEDADAVIVFGEDRLSEKLSPLFNVYGKLLLITNAGANAPLLSNNIPNTIFHSLHDCLYSYLTGKLCGLETNNKEALLATSFFDGGFHHTYAMTKGFERSGGEIRFNFVSQFKKVDFSIAPLLEFIANNPGVNNLLCLYSGDMLRCFYAAIAEINPKNNFKLYGSPMMFDRTPGDFEEALPFMHQVRGYTGWIPELDYDANQSFKAFFCYAKQKSRKPVFVSGLGSCHFVG